MKENVDFKIGEYCVYKTHGLAKIQDIQIIEFDNVESKFFVLYLEKEKLTISVPEDQFENTGIRKVCSKQDIDEVINILSTGPKKIKRGMWSRRAKEYEEIINSGNIFDIAKVVNELTREVEESDRSFSERMIYEAAIFRLASEYSVIENISIEEAKERIIKISKQKVKFVDISEQEEAKEA